MTRRTKNNIALIISFLLLAACSSYLTADTASQDSFKQVAAGEFALALPEPNAAKAVARILSDGGNAIDGAVTAAFTLAVTFPEAGNIGGGGFLLMQMNGQAHFLDYRETAPAAASRDMYLEPDGSVNPRNSLIGVRAAGVPGTVAGLWEAHQKFGTKPWAELIEPAINLARAGFEVSPQIAAEYAENAEWLGSEVNFAEHFSGLQSGGLFKQSDLADTLERIAKDGPADFYEGKTAKLIVAKMKKEGGLLSAADLANYRPVWRAPLVANWRGYQVVSAPPPSSGGFAVIHLLTMRDILDEQFVGVTHNSAGYVHMIAEMEKRVFADRAEYFGDPDFVDLPMRRIMEKDYIARRALEVDPEAISATEGVKPGLESPNTTHFSIVDRWGNAVSNSYTLNWSYGSGVVVDGAGFLLNNEMDDFSTKPGIPNIYGVIGGKANEIQPNKRMLSSMSPSLVLKDNQVEAVLGAMGGSTIFTSVFQVIMNLFDFEMNAKQAVEAGRFHHQLLPKDLITMSVNQPLPEEVQTELRQLGYRVEPHAFVFGDVQLVARRNGKLTAASDPRGIGLAIVSQP